MEGKISEATALSMARNPTALRERKQRLAQRRERYV
jgi:hypothetical protein